MGPRDRGARRAARRGPGAGGAGRHPAHAHRGRCLAAPGASRPGRRRLLPPHHPGTVPGGPVPGHRPRRLGLRGGAGRALLDHVQEHAHRAGVRRGELWVIVDNARAVGVYERAGWTATGDVEVRGSAGRAERRFVRGFG
ncbi:GNAT family N-acetyltransferase [Kineococcus sp. LSe6-4]|uniref:GNAT family N-acetyltransferase n=1 Tax=Kineococcus halophytocola TaxID=3234027 RepID=A0ABV4H0Z0_9ACTN